ncbi:MAG: hypothetical protein V3R84_05880, partial [Acidimicrobiia bacterium]
KYSFPLVFAADLEPWGVEAPLLPAWVLLDDGGHVVSGFTARVNVELEGGLVDLVEIGTSLPVSSLLDETIPSPYASWRAVAPHAEWQSSYDPVISIEAPEDGWYVQQIACDNHLDWFALRHYLVPAPAEVAVGPMRGDFVLSEVATAMESSFIGAETSTVELDSSPTVLLHGYTAGSIDLPGVRFTPGFGEVVSLYLVNTDTGLLFVTVTADEDFFEEFTERARPIVESVEIVSTEPWGECH